MGHKWNNHICFVTHNILRQIPFSLNVAQNQIIVGKICAIISNIEGGGVIFICLKHSIVVLSSVLWYVIMVSFYSKQYTYWQNTKRLITLTHWGRVTHICVSKLTIIGSDNGLSPGRRQAIIWTNAGIMLIRTLGTSFSEILIQIHTFSNKKMHLKLSSEKCRPFCLGLNVLTDKRTQWMWKSWDSICASFFRISVQHSLLAF